MTATEPTRREKILLGLRLAFALDEEEAENLLRMHDTDVARQTQVEIYELREPEVWALPLKWWRRGRDAALCVLARDVLDADLANRGFDEKGHKRRWEIRTKTE